MPEPQLPERALRSRPASGAPTSVGFRAMTYNILLGARGRVDAVARIVEAARPDVLAVQEANDEAIIRGLAERWRMRLVLRRSNSRFHTALLSPHPLIEESVCPKPGVLAKSLTLARVRLPAREVTVASMHLSAQPWHWPGAPLRRLAEIDEVIRLSAGADLLMGDSNARSPLDRLVATHPAPGLAGPFPRYPAAINRAILATARRRGCRPLQRWLVRREMPTEIIARLLAAGWRDAYRLANPDDPGYTWPAPWPLARIDFIFARPQLAARLVASRRIHTPLAWQGSDHLPVVADFRL